jgi:dephospho-CoA kinase
LVSHKVSNKYLRKRLIDLRIIGVTGCIGSGKSTVSKILKDLNAVVIDYDVVGRAVTARGGKAYVELVTYFGDEIIDANDDLDRKKLADIVFNDRVKLEALNTITHKHITNKVVESIKNLEAEGEVDIVVLDCPLPVKKGFLDLAEEIWVVSADLETRIKRIMERSNLTREEAHARINSQKTDEEYRKIADVVIENNGTVEELEKKVVKQFYAKKNE